MTPKNCIATHRVQGKTLRPFGSGMPVAGQCGIGMPARRLMTLTMQKTIEALLLMTLHEFEQNNRRHML